MLNKGSLAVRQQRKWLHVIKRFVAKAMQEVICSYVLKHPFFFDDIHGIGK